jgi:hypothetical protein
LRESAQLVEDRTSSGEQAWAAGSLSVIRYECPAGTDCEPANYLRFRLAPEPAIALAPRAKRTGEALIGEQRELCLLDRRRPPPPPPPAGLSDFPSLSSFAFRVEPCPHGGEPADGRAGVLVSGALQVSGCRYASVGGAVADLLDPWLDGLRFLWLR